MLVCLTSGVQVIAHHVAQTARPLTRLRGGRAPRGRHAAGASVLFPWHGPERRDRGPGEAASASGTWWSTVGIPQPRRGRRRSVVSTWRRRDPVESDEGTPRKSAPARVGRRSGGAASSMRVRSATALRSECLSAEPSGWQTVTGGFAVRNESVSLERCPLGQVRGTEVPMMTMFNEAIGCPAILDI